jgi:hypothetical protein
MENVMEGLDTVEQFYGIMEGNLLTRWRGRSG